MHHNALLKNILSQHRQSVTAARIAIFDTLASAGEPLRPSVVAKRTPSVDRSSTYRTLDLYTQLGITTTLTRGWHTYVELASPFQPHHHHFTCQACGAITDFTSEPLEDSLAGLASQHNFHVRQHSIELSGLCAHCYN